MITAHPLIQVHLIAPQLLLWIALPHHGDIMLATNYLCCRCYSVPFGQHAVVCGPLDWRDRKTCRCRRDDQQFSRTRSQRCPSELNKPEGGCESASGVPYGPGRVQSFHCLWPGTDASAVP